MMDDTKYRIKAIKQVQKMITQIHSWFAKDHETSLVKIIQLEAKSVLGAEEQVELAGLRENAAKVEGLLKESAQQIEWFQKELARLESL